MARLVECVPNFSEGRSTEVVDALAAAVERTPEAILLDRTSDRDHNRSVLTFAGPPEAVTAAMESAVAVALEQIDMDRHAGQHPRIGAVDVIPFVPLGDISMVECVALARNFGSRLAQRFELPVYLYGEAARRPDRAVLADIRRPQYEGLKDQIRLPDRAPDYGPSRMHPRGGAVAVGARPFLIAWNIDLETEDVELARRIAFAVRERSGGLPRIQALGLHLAERRCAQVSMNLLDFRVTPLWRAWERVGELAGEAGVRVRESELIGLAPVDALLEVAAHLGAAEDAPVEPRIRLAAEWLRIREFQPGQVLELRLAEATARP
ncbi:glutamate formimidoyltransferase [soil metagenome]